MELSTKFRYGARVLAELGRFYSERPIPTRELAEKQELSAKYLEHILASLKAAGIVRSVRGMHGGYELARKPSEIRLTEIYRVLEGSTAPVECVEDPEDCDFRDFCPTREVWIDIQKAIDRVLGDITVADLAERVKDRPESKPLMYNI